MMQQSPVPERAVLLFPALNKEMGIAVEALRKRFDPLYGLIAPHITLAFPFRLPLDDAALAAHIADATRGFPAFSIELGTVSLQQGPHGYYLLLNVLRGEKYLHALHERLYTGALAPCKSTIPYAPHLTLGKFSTREALTKAAALANGLTLDLVCETRIQTVWAERVGANGESIRIVRQPLAESSRQR